MDRSETDHFGASSFEGMKSLDRMQDDEEPPSRRSTHPIVAGPIRVSVSALPVLPTRQIEAASSGQTSYRSADLDLHQIKVQPDPSDREMPRVEGERTAVFRREFYPDATDREWDDWRWQSRHRIKSLVQMEQMLELSAAERGALQAGGTMLPVGVTPYYMSLLDRVDPTDPIRKTVVPTESEFVRTAGEADDPLGEDGHTPVPGLVHRYPDRVLLLAIDFCSTYCRYCTRSRVVGHGEIAPTESRLEKIFAYLEQATEVRDVLISGGDPLALSDDKLDFILGRLACDQAHRVCSAGDQDACGAAAADHSAALPGTAEIPSVLDEYSFFASR